MFSLPTVIETTGQRERAYDIYSRLLCDRIVFIGGEIDDASASAVVAQLLYLEAAAPGMDISLYINSPGGSVTAGLAILDTMHYIKCDVSTICVGRAASMGAVLLAGGTKGKRCALPDTEVMIHQPLGSAGGQASDVQIAAEHLLQTRERLYRILAASCGKTPEQIAQDCERDRWLTAEESVQYGMIDKVVTNRS